MFVGAPCPFAIDRFNAFMHGGPFHKLPQDIALSLQATELY